MWVGVETTKTSKRRFRDGNAAQCFTVSCFGFLLFRGEKSF